MHVVCRVLFDVLRVVCCLFVVFHVSFCVGVCSLLFDVTYLWFVVWHGLFVVCCFSGVV